MYFIRCWDEPYMTYMLVAKQFRLAELAGVLEYGYTPRAFVVSYVSYRGCWLLALLRLVAEPIL